MQVKKKNMTAACALLIFYISMIKKVLNVIVIVPKHCLPFWVSYLHYSTSAIELSVFYILDFAVSSRNLAIHSLLCLQCHGKDARCTNARCLSQTSLSHLKGLNRNTMIQCMNTMPWLAIQPIKISLLWWWLNRNLEISHMIQVGGRLFFISL